MRATVLEIVSREEELAAVRGFVDDARAGPAALVVEGEAGIGKSTLWLAGVEHARARGLRVLDSRPAEAERELAHVGLGDLVEDVLDEVLPALPAPRRRALEAALLLGERTEALDPRALGLALRSALQLLAADAPVLVAVDDLQWFDDSSARALAFALRRLREEHVRLLLAQRLGEETQGSPVAEAVATVERVQVGPLSVGALHRLLEARVARAFPRPTLLRLHEGSGGNPFYALELVRALGSEDAADPTQPLPVPDSLERLVRARLDGLGPATLDALALVAAAGRPTTATLRAAGAADRVLEPAFEAQVLERTPDAVRFSHPLLASAVYQGLSGDARRRAHRLLAGVADDRLVQARHLALAADGPEAETAATLDDAVAFAIAGGAPAAAAELAEHALRLTPPDADDDRHRRTLAAARAQVAAGNAARARALAEELLAAAPPGARRGEALVLLSDVEAIGGAIEHALALREQALVEAAGHAALEASIHQALALLLRETVGLRAGERHARASLRLAEELADDGLRAAALGSLGLLRFNAGEPDALDLVQRAHELAAGDEHLDATLPLAHVLTWSGRFGEARALLEPLQRELSERDELASGEALWYLSLVELGSGRLALAADHAARQREIRRQYASDEREDPLSIWPVARIAAHRGELARARALAEQSRSFSENLPPTLSGQEAVLGLVAAWEGRAGEAVSRFEAAERSRREAEIVEPAMYWWRADYVEALLELGRTEAAEEVLEAWEAEARRLGRSTVLAQVTRCRGLAAAAGADVAAALATLERAAAEHEAAGDPFGRARALLALGVVRRRGRGKRPAREAIEASLEAFEAIGAAGWAAKASRELGRIGGRTRADGLTAAELRVAALVAEGRTNREVAAALFLGERTVASHLTRVYAKLGVRSRTELARKVQTF